MHSELGHASHFEEKSRADIQEACAQELASQLKRIMSLLKSSPLDCSLEVRLTWSLQAAAAFLKYGKSAMVSSLFSDTIFIKDIWKVC